MVEFVEENRGEDIVGSTFGVVYEWVFHNAAYDVGTTFGIDSIVTAAEHLDVGKTIYDDIRDPLTPKWYMSEFMKGSYYLTFDFLAIYDYLCGIQWEYQNGK